MKVLPSFKMKLYGLLLCGVVLRMANSQSLRLEQYNIDRNHISVSGMGAGAAMAVQLHVAFSQTFIGVGSFAGVPYFCAQGSLVIANEICMTNPVNISVPDLVAEANNASTSRRIDDLINLREDAIFMYHGGSDTVIRDDAVDAVQEFYIAFGGFSSYQGIANAGHGMPTENKGNPCGSSSPPYINNCGFNGALESLDHIHGELQDPSGTLNGVFQEFNQTEFVSGAISFDEVGYMYVASRCVNKTIACKLHIALHGCSQGREFINDMYARDAGYNEVAESNDMIVLYPQARASVVLGNPEGCWDWWGYEDNPFIAFNYHVRVGPQMTAIKNMLDRVTG